MPLLALAFTLAAQAAPPPDAAARAPSTGAIPPTPAPAPAAAPVTEGFAFCAEVGVAPLAVHSVRGARAQVRVAPVVVAVSDAAPQVVVPRHVDERWPLRDVSAACLTRTPPALPERAGASIALTSAPALVFGCRADVVGADVLPGTLALADAPAPSTNVCLVGVDVRPPCPRRDSEDDPTFERRQKESALDTRARLARLMPRFGHGGPALLVRAAPARRNERLYLVERLLESEACGCTEDAAGVVSTRVLALRLPALTGPATLTVAVPRYVGAAYDLVFAADEEAVDAEAVTRLAYTDTFSALPPDEDDVVRVFSAPEACPCDCED